MIKRLLPVLISVFVISVNVLCADASENVLRGVNVSMSNKNSNAPYTIELTSSAPIKITKTILSENRIIINLKDVNISSNLTTKFNGNKVIDNVMVEPCGQDNVNVMVQGDNIAYSNIEFKSPTKLQVISDSIKSSFSSLFGIITGSSSKDRGVQLGILSILLAALFGEIVFIKSKCKEFKAEKERMLKDIESTSDFQDYLPGYGRTGLKKPYTTPIYSTSKFNTSVSRPNILSQLKTRETATLNSLLHNKNREDKIIDRIVNNKPVFGELSNIKFESIETSRNNRVSNPLEKSRLKANIKYLENMTARYKSTTTIRDLSDIGNDLATRLNKIY